MFNKLYEKVKCFIQEQYKFLLLLIAIIFIFTFEFPYVIYTPGGVVPLEKRIEIENMDYDKGSINMSYVTLRRGNIPTIILSYIIPNWDLFKEEEVTVDNESVDDLLNREKLYMESSLDNATILAYKKANKDLKITSSINTIVYITKEANTNLRLYDEIISVDDKKIDNINTLKEYINTLKEDDIVKIKVLRNKKEVICDAKVININNELKIGVSFLTTYKYQEKPEINIKTKNSESGSSGGLMLSLAIYNSLIDEDITNNKKVVGTGTIDILGNVGKIDGVKYKLLGAEKNKGDIFLCPVENLEEAMRVKKEFDLQIKVFGVKTFDEALKVLKDNL